MSLLTLECLSPAFVIYQSEIRNYIFNICSKIIVIFTCAFIQLNVHYTWLISTTDNTTHLFQWVFLYCFSAGMGKGCSPRQEAMGLCSAIAPLPPLIQEEVLFPPWSLSISGSQGLKAGRAKWVKANEATLPGGAWHSARRLRQRRRDALLQAHCPDSSPRLREEQDRAERPHDLSLRYFHAGVSDPLRFQVPKLTCTCRGCWGLGSAPIGKTLSGRFIHPY